MITEYRLLQAYGDRPRYPKWWLVGRPKDFWFLNKDLIASFIEKYRLPPAEFNELPQLQELEATEMVAASAHQERAIRPRPFPGGMLIPHLHWKGNVYPVPEELWQQLSVQIRDKFMDKLNKANSLSFEQVLTLSEAIDTL